MRGWKHPSRHGTSGEPGAILGALPGPGVRVKVLQVTGLLLVLGVLAAGASHGRAQEDVDNEHHKEKNPKGDAKVEKPDRRHPTVLAHI